MELTDNIKQKISEQTVKRTTKEMMADKSKDEASKEKEPEEQKRSRKKPAVIRYKMPSKDIYEVDENGTWRRIGTDHRGKPIYVDRKSEPANKKESRKARRGFSFRTRDGRTMKIKRQGKDGIGYTREVTK